MAGPPDTAGPAAGSRSRPGGTTRRVGEAEALAPSGRPVSWSVLCRDAGETTALGRGLGQAAAPGDLLLLYGPVGAGKTVFAGGVLDGLGVAGPHPSPTFTIVRTYAGRLPVAHLDLYRLRGRLDPDEIGLEDLLAGGDGVTIVEWAEHLGDLTPSAALQVQLARTGEPEARLLAFTDVGPAAGRLLRGIRRGGGGR